MGAGMTRRAALVILLLLAGCGGRKITEAPERDAWRRAGLEPTGFAKIDGAAYAGGRCEAGKVGGLDTVVCEYADDAAASRGVAAANAGLGEETAAVVPYERRMLVVADSKGVDPDGKRLNQVANIFRRKMP